MSAFALLAGTALAALTPGAVTIDDTITDTQRRTADGQHGEDILVQGRLAEAPAATKTDTPAIEVPQPVTTIASDTYLAQGAVSVADTVRYAAGVLADSYGRDTRVDTFTIRGVNALQFRDGMRDIYSYYVSIASDPYNFSRVEVVRGPAAVLFGQGSIGGLVNLVSKTPVFTNTGDVQLTYGSFDRKEVMVDLNLAASDTLAGRIVARVRDSGTFVDHVPDDRIMIAPSVTWRPDARTDVTLLGLYQQDKTGSTLNFLPIVGTVRDNRGRPPLHPYLFVGKPGWDRYDGRMWQGSALLTHRFSDAVKLSLKARYIDSHITYNTHYPDSYSNPTDPYVPGSDGRLIGLYAGAQLGRLNVLSTDNNVQARFDTGAHVEHTVLAGVDYSWNKVGKATTYGYQTIDLYDIDYASIATPIANGPYSRDTQSQLGLYAQDQIRFYDRVSVVFGVRRDHVIGHSGATRTSDSATTFRAGIIGEVAAHVSPFFSYTESFQPIAGSTSDGTPFRPQTGTQFEAGAKWQPGPHTMVTATAFRIQENGRPITGPGMRVTQTGELMTKGFELEATHSLPGRFDLSLAYGYNRITGDEEAAGYFPRTTASAWATKSFDAPLGTLRLGAGVRYAGSQVTSDASWSIVTPARAMVDALAEITRERWRLSLNATNLFNRQGYASCLTRGDCFTNAPRNVMLSLRYGF